MTAKSKAQKNAAAPDSTRRKIESLREVPAVYEFLTAHDLKMTGMKRAGKKYNDITGYDHFEFVVKFDVGDKAWTDAPEDMFPDGSVGKDALIAALAGVEFPKEEACKSRSPGDTAPKKLQNLLLDPRAWHDIDLSQDELLIPIYDQNGDCAMIEHRFIDEETHKKICVRWTHYADFKWRDDDPEQLPLWGLHLLQGSSIVFLHEGPKAAIAAMRMHRIDDLPIGLRREIKHHPWFEEFSKYPSLGWIGGTGRVDRIDLGVLKRLGVKKVYVVPDNDAGGRSAAHEIVKRLYGVDAEIMNPYGDEFGLGWDLADPVPDGASFPGWSDYTRMTTVAGSGRNGPVFKLRPGYPKGVSFVKEIQRWVPAEAMHLRLTDEELGKFYRNNIDAGARPQFADLIAASGTDFSFEALGFLPRGPKSISIEGGRALNLWRPSGIEPRPMTDEGRLMFDRYFELIAPNPLERALLRRWIASVIARPERKFFGVCLYSATQGTGKTTLFEAILAPILGARYCVEATMDDLTTNFSDWREAKVLVFADDIVAETSGTSKKTYQMLKTMVTSRTARIEGKGEKRREIADYAKLLLATNQELTLYLEGSDRRWLVVHAAEQPMDHEFATDLRRWLGGGGVAEVVWWALNYEGCYVDAEGEGVTSEVTGDGCRWTAGSEPPIPAEVFDEIRGRNVSFDERPKYFSEGCTAPFTDAKAELRSKAVPLAYKGIGDVMDVLENFQTIALARGEDDFGEEWKDGQERMVGVSTVVIAEALKSMAMHRTRKKVDVEQTEIAKYAANLGYFYCLSVDQNSKDTTKPKPYRHAMNTDRGVVNPRARSIIMNSKAVDAAEEAGVIVNVNRILGTYELPGNSWRPLVAFLKKGDGVTRSLVIDQVFAYPDGEFQRYVVDEKRWREAVGKDASEVAADRGIDVLEGGKAGDKKG